MKFKRLVSALLSAAIAAGTAFAAAPLSTFAYTYPDSLTDVVSYGDWYVGNEICEPLVSYIERIKKKSIETVTYADLLTITSLDLSNKGLTGVPKAIEHFHALKTLNLSKNSLISDGTDSINSLDLSQYYQLSAVYLNDNFLTRIPSWFADSDARTKNINNNLIYTTKPATSGQLQLVTAKENYFFTIGDKVDESELKQEIFSKLKLSDGRQLPLAYYDPKYSYEYNNLTIEIDLDLSSYVDTDLKATKAGTIEGSIYIVSAVSNPNATAKFKIYIMSADTADTAMLRLESTIAEGKTLKQSDYTASSWASFDRALKSAQSIYTNKNATLEMIKEAYKSLDKKTKALEKGLDDATKKTLTEHIAIAKALKQEEYTSASWADFAVAYANATAALNDKDTSLSAAQSIILKLMNTMSDLVSKKTTVPTGATKEAFQALVGTKNTLSFTGLTQDGYQYKWEFSGENITSPASINLEIQYSSKNTDAMVSYLNTNSFHQISFRETASFPGTAKVTLDISKTFKDGYLELYKFDSTTKSATQVGTFVVKNGSITIDVRSGGEYYLVRSAASQDLSSNTYTINTAKMVIYKIQPKTTLDTFKASMTGSTQFTVYSKDGTALLSSDYVTTHSVLKTADGHSYTLSVLGDLDASGTMEIMDALLLLDYYVKDQTTISNDPALLYAGELNGDNAVGLTDVLVILDSIVS